MDRAIRDNFSKTKEISSSRSAQHVYSLFNRGVIMSLSFV